jgi:hypothetical protein
MNLKDLPKKLTMDIKTLSELTIRENSRYNCLDCKINTRSINEYYMVHRHVWSVANPKRHGMLCIGCLENRLCRTLTKEDFTDCLVNKRNLSERLKNRLGLI